MRTIEKLESFADVQGRGRKKNQVSETQSSFKENSKSEILSNCIREHIEFLRKVTLRDKKTMELDSRIGRGTGF